MEKEKSRGSSSASGEFRRENVAEDVALACAEDALYGEIACAVEQYIETYQKIFLTPAACAEDALYGEIACAVEKYIETCRKIFLTTTA